VFRNETNVILYVRQKSQSHAGVTDLGNKQMRAGTDSSAGPSF